ncbi:tail protein X [Aeromonas schubertii]|uniref:Tail protein X n=1 Tax=Aeromonas schubertii TaxID=652 RepID=A0ABS7V5P7_9GAMM|nr:tail protein X [Aeromonas schubertii]MBZ6064697.1 tail protein X [Aeromonas schubertii]
MQLRAQQGETLDLILHRHYGYTAGITEQVLALNPGLADQGPLLPIGTLITLPDAPTHATAPLIQLWD